MFQESSVSTVQDRITTMLIDRFGVPREELRPDATFAELDLDSLALVEFALVVEKEFGVPMGEDEVSTGATISDAVELIVSKSPAA
jgi:acyl carrier protein